MSARVKIHSKPVPRMETARGSFLGPTVPTHKVLSLRTVVILNLIIGLYISERWLIRPQVAAFLGVSDTRNIGIPDIVVLLTFFAVSSLKDGWRLTGAVTRWFRFPLACYILGGWLVTLGLPGNTMEVDGAFWASGQLVFCFFVLGPVLAFLVERLGLFISLLSFSSWVGLAGALSLTDRLGLTSFAIHEYHRMENPLLGVNGFYLVGLLVPFMILSVFRSIDNNRHWLAAFIIVLTLLSQIGLFLAGVRTGLIISLCGCLIGVLLTLYFLGMGVDKWVSGLLMVGITVSFAALILSREGDVLGLATSYQMRAEAGEELLQDSGRLETFQSAWSQLSGGAWLTGNGINQWAVVNPDDEVHNVLLMAWWEGGILGLVGWSYLYLSSIIKLSKTALVQESVGQKGVLWTSVFILGGSLAAGMVYPIGYSRSDWVLFLIASAPIYCASRVQEY
ncbi:MAG: hypothetical protein WCT12_13425 [Verrucomicrobiota bacterium]